MIPRIESDLKSAFFKEQKKKLLGFVVIRHEDIRTGGTPDLSVTGLGRTTWYEFKHCTPQCSKHQLQELICERLAAAGFCRYVVYWEKGLFKRTMIVHPRNITSLIPEVSVVGFNHQFVIDYIRQVHTL